MTASQALLFCLSTMQWQALDAVSGMFLLTVCNNDASIS
jgi:hypothetical protein